MAHEAIHRALFETDLWEKKRSENEILKHRAIHL
jgi:hypothetical protein